MQRCAKLLRLWNNGGIGVPIRTGFPVPALASYCAPVAQQVKLEGPETSSMWSYGNNMIPTTSEELYSKSRILKSCEMCVRRGNLKFSLVHLTKAMKMCTTTLINEKPEVKVQIADAIFEMFKQAGMKRDTSLYNQLLRVYCHNNHRFVPSEFLECMKKDDCHPSLGTFNLLTEAYGNQGNMNGVLKLLEVMKGMGLPMSETLYAAMATGHSRAGDLEAAKGVLETMKADGHSSSDAVYTSLLCAYAERGLLEDIMKTYDRMKQEDVSPSAQTNILVMDTLSMHGHGTLVADILSLMKSKTWLNQGLRSLCFGCFSRGEIEAPLILLPHLSRTPSFNDNFIVSYFPAAFENGLVLNEAIAKLKQHVNVQSFKWLPHNIIYSILYPHQNVPDDVDEIPVKGFLKPHPWGKRWILETREALKLLRTHKKLQDFHFYPLLARHCSDADIKELVKTFYMMVDCNSGLYSAVNKYISGTIRNAGITVDEFLSSQQLHEEADPHWLGELLIFQCAHGKWGAAASTLKKAGDNEQLIKYAKVMDHAVHFATISETNAEDCLDFVVALNKYGDTFSDVLMHFYWNKGNLNGHLFNRLWNKGVKFSLDGVIRHYKKLLEQKKLVEPMKLWSLLEKAKHYTPADNVVGTIYECVLRTCGGSQFSLKKASQLYAKMPQWDKEKFDIRCLHVVELTANKDFRIALKEFLALLEIGRAIPVLTWKRVVCAAYNHDPAIGDDMLRKMKERNVFPDGFMMYNLLTIHVRREDLTRAEDILKSLEEREELYETGNLHKLDVDMSKSYKTILFLWAENGDLNKILKVKECGIIDHKSYLIEAEVLALVKTKQIDHALTAAAGLKAHSQKFLRSLVQMLIDNEYSLTEWREVLLKEGVSEKLLETIVLFTYMDYDLKKARTLLQNLKEIHPEELHWRMRTSQARIYENILNKWGLHVAHVMNTAEPQDIKDPTITNAESLDFDQLFEHMVGVDKMESESKEKGDIPQ